MNAILIQPPFTQLNAPYPAIHYLEAFLRGRGHEAAAWDHSIGLYRRIFSSAGLAKVFAGVREKRAGLKLDEASRVQLERYLSNERLYIEWIDGIVAFLSGGDPAMAHRLASAVELPIGARAEALLEARDGRIGPDEARALATRILDDLGDLIAFALDPDFGTVRYAERLASSRADFGEALKALDNSWLIREFYEPMLREFWTERARAAAETPAVEGRANEGAVDLILITIPFPGCLLGALACARAARQAFASSVPRRAAARAFGGGSARAPAIAFGGGYVSTELRDLRDSGIFDFCDYLCFDAGYGSLASILERGTVSRVLSGTPSGAAADAVATEDASAAADAAAGAAAAANAAPPLYKTMTRGAEGSIVASGFSAEASADASTEALGGAPAWERFREIERTALAAVAPDYRSADFGAYLRVVDSENPMHRLWSDTPWLKYYLAHGCYWRRCSFCDTELDYVADFARADVGAVMAAAASAAERTGLYGIHFVDEALPMAALLEFARANRARAAGADVGSGDSGGSGGIAAALRRRPFSFWGNVRFDASWTQGRCEFLAASGLVAVSAGIEIATARGLAMTDKGFDLAGLVRTLVAMRRAGLLVHAYLIYGFPGQPAADIVDSAEFCRQLFASGLVDSAFWHRFVLTRHSRMYRQWRDGGRPELKPIDRPWSFANNDLAFEGERAFDRFDAPLAASLAAWMEGAELERPASTWFGRGAPRASIAPDFVETLIEKAEAALDAEEPAAGARAHWIAGIPFVKEANRGSARLSWAYRGEMVSLELSGADAVRAAEILAAPELGYRGAPYAELASRLALPPEAMAELRASGLALT